jgi:signal transduction histidine kinase
MRRRLSLARLSKMVARPRAVTLLSRVTPVLLAVGGTVEYSAAATPHLARALLFLYAATAALLLNQRYPVASPLTALTILATLSMVDPHAATDPNVPLLISMFAVFVLAAFNREAPAVAGGLAALGLLALITVRVPDPSVSGLVVLVLLLLVAWGAGRLLALRDQVAEDLREQESHAAGERAAEAERAVQAERSRIARELHDIVAHHISVIMVQARGGRRSLAVDPDDARSAFDAIERMGAGALTEMRSLLGILRTDEEGAPLMPSPSLGRLDHLVEQLRSSGRRIELVVHGAPAALPPGLDSAAYRVVQEALTNVVKHAEKAPAVVQIHYRADEIELQILDEGSRSTDSSTSSVGPQHGLLGMRERVALYGGTFSAGPRPGGGFAVQATLPIREPVL